MSICLSLKALVFESKANTYGDVWQHFLPSLEINEKLIKGIWLSALNMHLFCSALKNVIGMYCSFDCIQPELKNLIRGIWEIWWAEETVTVGGGGWMDTVENENMTWIKHASDSRPGNTKGERKKKQLDKICGSV